MTAYQRFKKAIAAIYDHLKNIGGRVPQKLIDAVNEAADDMRQEE